MTESRLLFRQALIDATLELANDLRDKKRVEYSAQHRKRMRSMGVAIGLSTRAKILISLVAAAILLTGCAVFRERIAGLFLTVGDGFVNVEGDVTPDAPKEIEHAYVPSYIPDGFTEVERVEVGYKVKTVWQNSNGDFIEILQGTIYGTGFDADTKYAETSIIELEQFDVLNIEANNYSLFYWSNGLYSFKLSAGPNIDQNTAINIIESLK